MNPTLLSVAGLGRRIGDRWIWRDLDLALEPGQRAMLVGPSGTGKSLLLRTLCGLDPPDAGDVLYRGAPVKGKDVPAFRGEVIYVQQTPALIPGTVAANIELPRRFAVHQRALPGTDRATELLVGLGKPPEFIEQRVSLLSGGERQLVGLVRAMVLDPVVLLLDEPTAHLDPDTTAGVEALIERWAGGGERAVLWTSHDPAQVTRVRHGPLLELGGET